MTMYDVKPESVPASTGALTTYEVKPDPVPAMTGALTTVEVHRILAGLDPAALQDAGAAHTQLGRELGTVAAHLAQEAGTLADNWSGPAARTALTQFQRLHEQTAALATQATQTGTVLTWLGTQVVPALQHPADPAQAHDYLTQLTADLIRADTSLPSHIGSPGITGVPASTRPPVSTRLPVNAGLSSPTPHVSSTHPVSPKTPASPTSATHHTTTVSSLQSAAPTPAPGASMANTTSSSAPAPTPPAGSATSPAPTPVALAGAPPASPASSAPSNPATTPVAADVPAEADTSTDYLPLAPSILTGTTTSGSSQDAKDKGSQQAPTAQTASATTQQASPPLPAHTTTAATTPGNGQFLPSNPGVITPRTQERHRDSWTPEDRNLWGLPADCVPPVIAGA
jgi:hypothetical protein